MKILKPLIAAFSTFSRIPVSFVNLDEDDFKNVMCFLPAVGMVTGVLEAVVFGISKAFGCSAVFRVCVMTALPVLLTGGIHLDGLCDTADACNSFSTIEHRLEILKDPHIGAFGVIRLIIWILLFMAAVSEVNENNVLLFAGVFVISRAVTAVSVVLFKPAKNTGMGMREHESSNINKVIVSSVVFVLITVAFTVMYSIHYNENGDYMYAVAGYIILIAASLLYLLFYRKKMYGIFGGVTGDTAGWLLCNLELMMTWIVVIAGF